MSVPQGEVVFVDDLASAGWLVDRLEEFTGNVGSVVPVGFDAYARLFHPASLGDRSVTWGEIAEANGTTMHPEAQFEAISGVDPWTASQPGLWDRPPELGHLPGTTFGDSDDLVGPLVSALTKYTANPERVWFCVWEGWGGLHHPETDARVLLPGRGYWLLRGPISAACGGFDSIQARGPSIWWPDDRAWCVATEIDFRWTYVAGCQTLIDELVTDAAFEALRTETSHGVRIDSDRVNRRG